MSMPYHKSNIPNARALRKQATAEENHLWYDYLRHVRPRFVRQKAIDHFIADFYCHRARVVIELDGSQHYTAEGRKHDEFRTEILEGYDLRVIRFSNRQIRENFAGVCAYIEKTVNELLAIG